MRDDKQQPKNKKNWGLCTKENVEGKQQKNTLKTKKGPNHAAPSGNGGWRASDSGKKEKRGNWGWCSKEEGGRALYWPAQEA